MKIDLNQLCKVGHDLHRPECVLCCKSGNVYVSDWRGGVTKISPSGEQIAIIDERHGDALKPNGIAMLPDGSFLLANLGDAGGVWSLSKAGVAKPWLTKVDGRALPPCNYVMLDKFGRIWITVSTRLQPRQRAYRSDVSDGFIVLVANNRAGIVADGLGYTNEVQLDYAGHTLYVVETFARRLSKFRVDDDGMLKAKETVTEFGAGTFPDGLALDTQDGLWVTSIVSNRLFRVLNGRVETVLEDADETHVQAVEKAFLTGNMQRSHLESILSRRLRSVSSVAFGGPDLKTLYLGCLLDDSIQKVTQSFTGVEPVHWHWG